MHLSLASSGFIPEVEEVSKIFSLPLRYEPPQTGFGQQGSLGLATEVPEKNGIGLSADKSDKSDLSDLSDALTEWLGPLAAELDQLSADTEISDEEFSRRLSACAEGRKNGSTGKLETFLEGQIYDGMARGMTS